MNKSIYENPCKAITGKSCRLSYEHVWEPASINGGKPRYSACVMIPKSDTVTVERVRKAIDAAYHEGESTLKGSGKSVPPKSAIKMPLRDGDLERPDDPAFAGMWFVNANTDHAPGIVGPSGTTLFDRSEVYSGCYCRFSLTFFAFNSNGNRGIACGLNNLQKVKDGERLGGRISAEVEFAGLDDDDDDESEIDEDFLE